MEKVQPIVKKALDLVDELLKRKVSLDKEKEKIVKAGQKQDDVAKIQEDKFKEIEEREIAIKPIEDIVAFEQRTNLSAKQVHDGLVAFENAKKSFEAYKNAEREKITQRQKEVNKMEEKFKRELAALKKTREELAKDKAGLKGKVLGELAKNI